MTVKANLFPGGVRRALTMSYDDGQIFDVRLAELFDKVSTIVDEQGAGLAHPHVIVFQ